MLGIWQIANRKRNKDSMYSQSRICVLVFIILFVIYRNDFMLENANALLPNSYYDKYLPEKQKITIFSSITLLSSFIN